MDRSARRRSGTLQSRVSADARVPDDAVPQRDEPQELAALGGTYRLLARLWSGELDATLLRELLQPPLCDVFAAAGGVLPAGCDDTAIEELAIDYCQLFIGPTHHLPPFQSVWQTGQFCGAPVESMKRFADAVGFDTGELPRGMMLDHLGVQLDVMGQILACLPFSSQDPQREVLDLARAFFATHLLWATPLLQAAGQRATTDFYRSTVRLTENFLVAEEQFWYPET